MYVGLPEKAKWNERKLLARKSALQSPRANRVDAAPSAEEDRER
jgi:hypothetical protein